MEKLLLGLRASIPRMCLSSDERNSPQTEGLTEHLFGQFGRHGLSKGGYTWQPSGFLVTYCLRKVAITYCTSMVHVT